MEDLVQVDSEADSEADSEVDSEVDSEAEVEPQEVGNALYFLRKNKLIGTPLKSYSDRILFSKKRL